MKRYKLLYSSLFALLIAGTSVTSCKDYLDVNDNPNYPVTTTMSALLPSACASTISQLGLYGDLMGDMWLQNGMGKSDTRPCLLPTPAPQTFLPHEGFADNRTFCPCL